MIFQPFDTFAQACLEKRHNLAADDLRVMLTNKEPKPTHTVASDIKQIQDRNGYRFGGEAATVASSSQVKGEYSLILRRAHFEALVLWEPFQFAVVYNATSHRLIGFYDYGEPIEMEYGDLFDVEFDGAFLTAEVV